MSGRASRALVIEEPLSILLAALTEAEGTRPAGHVDLDVLFAVEVALGYSFADDLLAAFAADLPTLRASHRFALAEVIGHGGRLRDARVRGDLIGIAADEDDEYVVDKSGATKASTVVLRLEAGGSGAILERLELDAFLFRVTGFGGELAPGRRFLGSLHRKPAMADVPGQIVIHKVFGRGTAFSEKGDGPTRKVTCDFPGVGLKIIQARFLVFADEHES